MSRMKQLREEKKVTQEELAFALDISQQRVSKIECNKATMNEKLIINCAEYFGVTTDYLLGTSDIRTEIDIDGISTKKMNEAMVRQLMYYFGRMNAKEQNAVINMEKLIYDLREKE